MAESLGVSFGDAKVLILHKDVNDSQKAQKVMDFVSYHSHFNRDNGEYLELMLSSVMTKNFTEGGGEYYLPKEVWQNIAIVHLEEWLHLDQFLSGKPLAGEEDSEIDVALYMKQRGINLTDHFLSGHGRRKFFEEHPNL